MTMTSPPRTLHLLAAAALMAATLAVVAEHAGGASGAAPPMRLSCTTDTDCPGCNRCQMGFCTDAEWTGQTCMCDSECRAVGQASCDLSGTKPLCGGRCSNRQAAAELPCGTGSDVTRVEAFPGTSGEGSGAAVVRGDQVVVVKEVHP